MPNPNMMGPNTALTVGESAPHWEPPITPPDGAPNVLVIVLDDTGFSHLGCFGSDIDTPNIDRLAAKGLRYTNFHTTALCSPTRASLLTGRNHHSVGMRWLSNVDTGFSNCRGRISPSCGTMAEILNSNGYSTFAVGKWHLANLEDCGPAGPMHDWPLQRGFDRFYGWMGGATDQFSPELFKDNHPLDPPNEPGYHVSEDIVDQMMAMFTTQQSVSQGAPFFGYVAFGATHSPHQAPPEFLEKYRGRYDAGWDEIRQQWYERQIELGVIPEGTTLAPRNRGVEAWDDLSDDQRAVFARMQEVFAGFLDHTDTQIGRLIERLEALGALDNTLVVLMSDNGASQEGGFEGTLNELGYFNRQSSTAADMIADIDKIGGPNLYNNYPRGWSQVGNTPLRFYKQNTYEGGIRDPLIISWPAGIADAGATRTQYHHVSDILPTVLDCVGLDAPEVYKGITQKPIEGTSIRYSFDAEAATEPSTRRRQYYEMAGHRAIYADGWKAVTMHRPGVPFEDDEWALYHTDVDFTECNDLAAEQPEKLAEMKQLWWVEAGRFNVLPMDDRGAELMTLRKPGADGPGNRIRYLAGTPHLERSTAPDVRNRSFVLRSSLTRAAGDNGVVLAFGARTGGLAMYVADDHLVFAYNYLGKPTSVRSKQPLPTGDIEVAASYAKSEDHKGTVTLLINGEADAIGDFETMPFRQTLFGLDIGRDAGPTVVDDYDGPFPFEGELHWVEFELQNDRADLAEAAEVELANQLAEQ